MSEGRILDFTVVLGCDAKHVEKLALCWENWRRNRPTLFCRDIIIFVDSDAAATSVCDIVKPDGDRIKVVAWEPNGDWESDGSRWTDPQRQKMLAGFVHIPARYVHNTEYWLKLDLDVIAKTVHDDSWIKQRWFRTNPAIVGHRWGYTKPAHQMQSLDMWVEAYGHREEMQLLATSPPLNIRPKEEDAGAVSHPRIISWCAFFRTDFTKQCSNWAHLTSVKQVSGEYLTERSDELPVPSQDGFMWYCAQRLRQEVLRLNMKRDGQWIHKSTLKGMKEALSEL